MLSHLSSYFEHVEGRAGLHRMLQQAVQQGNPVLSSVTMEQLMGGLHMSW